MIKISLYNPSVKLSRFDADQDNNSFFNNINIAPDAEELFQDADAVEEWLNNTTELPSEADALYKSDSGSFQGWTYVADYKTHQYSIDEGKTYYIHARINSLNKLEFTFFNKIINNNKAKNYKKLNYDAVNGNDTKLLKIATKEEAEKFILSSDKSKIKVSALPKYAGYLSDYSERLINGVLYNVFGNIYTYWYAISDNTLYFCGFPLYTGNDKGLIRNSNNNLVEADIPPTHLNYYNAVENDPFKTALDMVIRKESTPDADGLYSGARMILKKFGNTTEPTKITTVVLSKDDEQIYGGDIFNNINAYSEIGGTHYNGESIVLTDFYNQSIEKSTEEDLAKICGGTLVKTVLAEENEDGSLYLYENARYTNMFVITSFNNNISIAISESVYHFGEGTRYDEYKKDDYFWHDDDGGGDGGGGGGGGGGKPKKNTTKRNKKPLRIYAGDIGYEYLGDTAWDLTSEPMYTADVPVSATTKQTRSAEGGFASDIFDYELDKLKVASLGVAYVDDTQNSVLTKKLSRKLDLSLLCVPAIWERYSIADRYLEFQNFFINPGDDKYLYIAPRGSGYNGQVAMHVSARDTTANDENKIALNFKTGTTKLTDWPNTIDIQSLNYIFTNNCLVLFYKNIIKYVPDTYVITQVEPGEVMENKNIVVTNTMFLRKWATINKEPIIDSFPVPPSVAGRSRVTICYKIRKFKLIPDHQLFDDAMNLFISKEQHGEFDKMQLKTLHPITYSKLENNIESEISLYDEIINETTISSRIVNEGCQTWEENAETGEGRWSSLDTSNTSRDSVLPPIEINLSNIVTGPAGSTINGIEYANPCDDAQEEDICILTTDFKTTISWSGSPKMQLCASVLENPLKESAVDNSESEDDEDNEPIKQSILIEYMQTGDGWWEAATQDNPDGWQTDNQRYRFSIDAPSQYYYMSKSNTNKGNIKLNFFTKEGNCPTLGDNFFVEMEQPN